MDAFVLLHTDATEKFHGRTYFGAFTELEGRLHAMNAMGYSVFYTINRTDGQGRKAENIVAARTIFSDLDNGLPEKWLVPPSTIIESSPNRYQAYWHLSEETQDFAKWARVEGGVVRGTGGDTNARDLARIFRVPGFVNHKRATKCQVVVKESNALTYNLEVLAEAYGELDPPRHLALITPPEGALPPEAQRIKRFRGWLNACKFPTGGERNGALFRAAAKGLRDFACGYDDVYDALQEWWYAHDQSGDDPRLEGLVRNASRSASGVVGAAYVTQPAQFELRGVE